MLLTISNMSRCKKQLPPRNLEANHQFPASIITPFEVKEACLFFSSSSPSPFSTAGDPHRAGGRRQNADDDRHSTERLRRFSQPRRHKEVFQERNSPCHPFIERDGTFASQSFWKIVCLENAVLMECQLALV